MNDSIQKNVLGEPLEICGSDPITGYYRDGACNTDETDRGSHTVCASVTAVSYTHLRAHETR